MSGSKSRGLTLKQYRVLAIIACFFIAAIIVTGASVRLTGSGLGCPTWPKCTSDSFTPKSSETGHAFVEFANRVFTGLLSISVIAAVGGSIFRKPRSKPLIWLSASLVFGVIAQIVLGGITVLLDLHPLSVGAHMLLSCFILSFSVILAALSKYEVTPSLKNLVKVSQNSIVMALTYLVVVLGIVVTATGPHAGDARTKRLDASLESVARIHSLSAWALLGFICFLLFIKKVKSKNLKLLLEIVFIQGVWGYAQYAAGVPWLMVLVHIFLATVLFIVASRYWIESITENSKVKSAVV